MNFLDNLRMNFLDNLQVFFIAFLFFSVRRTQIHKTSQDPNPYPGWFSVSRTSMEHLTQKLNIQKKKLQNNQKIHSMVFLISFTGQDLKPRIRIPNPHHCVIDRVLLDIRPFFISGIRPDIWFKLPDNRISGRISGLAVAEMMSSSNEQTFFQNFFIRKN